jgi:hypothetical protein
MVKDGWIYTEQPTFASTVILLPLQRLVRCIGLLYISRWRQLDRWYMQYKSNRCQDKKYKWQSRTSLSHQLDSMKEGKTQINSILLIPPLLTQPSLRNGFSSTSLGGITQSMDQMIPWSTGTEILPCREHKLWFVCISLFEGCELVLSVSLTVEMDDKLTFVVWSSSWSEDIWASSWGAAVS